MGISSARYSLNPAGTLEKGMTRVSSIVNHHPNIWRLPQMGVPPNGLFIRENPIKVDDLGVPPFMETPILKGDIILTT